MTLYRAIIAATNFSDTANNAVTYAAGFAKATGTKLILFHSFSLSIHSANSRISSEGMQQELDKTSLRLERLGTEIATLFEMSVVQLLTFNNTEEEQKFVNELETIHKKLTERETEVIDLQKKVIELFEELRVKKVTA